MHVAALRDQKADRTSVQVREVLGGGLDPADSTFSLRIAARGVAGWVLVGCWLGVGWEQRGKKVQYDARSVVSLVLACVCTGYGRRAAAVLDLQPERHAVHAAHLRFVA